MRSLSPGLLPAVKKYILEGFISEVGEIRQNPFLKLENVVATFYKTITNIIFFSNRLQTTYTFAIWF